MPIRQSYGTHRPVVVVLMLVGGILCPLHAEAQKVPSSVSALLPAGARLDSGSWGVFDTEFGKTFTGDMRATFPGRPSSCDITVGPELRVSLKGDTAWEEPPMLDMAVQQFTADIGAARASLPARVAQLRKTNGGVKSVGTLKEEHLPNGELLYIEYAEDCSRHPNGTNTVLRGFARRGATMLSFDLWISAGAAEAASLAKDMFARFQKLDVAAAIK